MSDQQVVKRDNLAHVPNILAAGALAGVFCVAVSVMHLLDW